MPDLELNGACGRSGRSQVSSGVASASRVVAAVGARLTASWRITRGGLAPKPPFVKKTAGAASEESAIGRCIVQ